VTVSERNIDEENINENESGSARKLNYKERRNWKTFSTVGPNY